MLGPGRYLLGVVELVLLLVSAWLGAGRVRERLLPRFEGVPAALATAVLALALLIWVAEILGTVSLFEPVPYLVVVVAVGIGLWRFVGAAPSPEGGIPHPHLQVGVRDPSLRGDGSGAEGLIPTLVALLVALIAVVHFVGGVKTRLSTGMTGFDSTWYHGPFAAGFFQSGNTIDLHFIAPQFLAWFYPANGEIFHAVGMLAFARDLLSPLLNLGWFVGCLVACLCIGRPYRVGAWSLALGAVALSVPALSDQAGEARNDIVGIFFLLAAVAVALNSWGGGDEKPDGSERDAQQAGRGGGSGGGRGSARRGLETGALLVVGLSAGLAAGTKLNFLLPAAVLVLGLVVIAPHGGRWHALWVSGLAALAGGGYWYLRNLVQSGNPLPWIHHLGPIDLPAPEQALGGREAHSVLGYLTDGTVWSDWFLPGLHHAFWFLWPLLGLAALAGLVLCLWSGLSDLRRSWSDGDSQADTDRANAVLAIAAAVGLASALAWLIAPTSASGPDGMPRGFESGLRYLAPALILGLALLPTAPLLRQRRASLSAWSPFRPASERNDSHERSSFQTDSGWNVNHGRMGRAWVVMMGLVLVVVAVVVGYPVQRHYLKDRYADPSFTTPGLNAAFKWSRDLSDQRIATTSTRQYPLFGTDLSNHVQYIGEERPHGGFEAPQTCRRYRELLNAGDYDYVIASRDRIEAGKRPYPPEAKWTEGPGSVVVLKKPPTVVFKLSGKLPPSACP
ncbi:MAG TPA: hypothetical protein VMS11_10350 [Solirubrobacterales bacterium]|nr:hypothetical protein [Solirubrobacterales bacterium]